MAQATAFAAPAEPPTAAYADDFDLWLKAQIALIASGRLGEIDIPHVLEELEGLSSSQHQALTSRLARIIEHLLKLAHSPDQPPRAGWCETIDEQRFQIMLLFDASPSLRRQVPAYADHAYPRVRRLLLRQRRAEETAAMPAANPFTPDQLLDADFIPAGRPTPA